MQIGAITLEEFVWGNLQKNIEIARRATTHAGLAFTGEPDPGSVLYAGRNVD
jgi:hypothetical protein